MAKVVNSHVLQPSARGCSTQKHPATQQGRRKREELLLATEAELRVIADAAARRRPGQALGARGNKRKMLKHFDITPGMDTMTFRRNEAGIAAEAALDGICVVRTSLPAGSIGPEGAVEAYKALAGVERAFRRAKSDLRVRPIHVRTEEHVRAMCSCACLHTM